MIARPMRFGVLASTGGAVLGQMLLSSWFREHLALVVTDRACGARARAIAHGRPVVTVDARDPALRERAMADAFREAEVDHVLLFYTRLLRHDLLERYAGRLWNLHPALLPAFPGPHGFEDARRAGARLLGTTIHAVDAGMDTGPVLAQSVFAGAPGATESDLRHALFGQQVRMALQTCRWLAQERVTLEGDRVLVRDEPAPMFLAGALYAPGLDDTEARMLAIPAFMPQETLR